MTNKLLNTVIFAITMVVSSYAYSSIEMNLETAMIATSSIEGDISDYSEFLNDNFENLDVAVKADADKEQVLKELEILEQIMNGDISALGVKLELVECTHPACIYSDNSNEESLMTTRSL